MHSRNCLIMRELPLKPGEVGACALAERMPAPDARVHVEQLGATVTFVSLELDLYKSAVAHRLNQTRRGRLDVSLPQGFHVGARASKLHWKLAQAARGDAGLWVAREGEFWRLADQP